MCAFCARDRDDRCKGLDDLDESGARSARGSATEQPMAARQHRVGTLETHDRGKGLHGPSSSSSSQLEQRVGMLETLAQTLQQSLSQALQQNIDLRDVVGALQTLVENLQQRLEQALQRVEELEATVENWQQEQWECNWQ